MTPGAQDIRHRRVIFKKQRSERRESQARAACDIAFPLSETARGIKRTLGNVLPSRAATRAPPPPPPLKHLPRRARHCSIARLAHGVVAPPRGGARQESARRRRRPNQAQKACRKRHADQALRRGADLRVRRRAGDVGDTAAVGGGARGGSSEEHPALRIIVVPRLVVVPNIAGGPLAGARKPRDQTGGDGSTVTVSNSS